MLVDPKPITVGQRLGVIQCAGPYLLTTAVAHYIGASSLVCFSPPLLSVTYQTFLKAPCIFYVLTFVHYLHNCQVALIYTNTLCIVCEW